MATIQSFKVKCSMSLITVSEEEYKISPIYIKNVMTEYLFEDCIMPIIYAILEVDPNIYEKLLDNVKDGIITMRVINYDANREMGLEKEIINDQFTYFIPAKYNYTKKVEGSTDMGPFDTDHIILGMIKAEMIYLNKKSFNGVFTNTSVSSLLERFMEDLPELVMDELEEDTEFESFLLPPQETRANAIDFLFNQNPFFSTAYNFFMDFKKTFLIDTSGKARETAKATILFKIQNIDSRSAYYTGISKDAEDGTYIVYVNQSDVNVSINTTTDKKYNQIVSTYTDEVTITDSNITMYSKDTTNKQNIVQANEMVADIKKSIMDNTAIIIQLIKMNLDSTLITPEKQYMVDYDEYSSYNGRYLLMYKKEVIAQAGEAYDTTTTIGLKRIAGQEEEL